ncbi:hypothetical protein BDZ91DRAFT_765595 [Kalaharituber pfeilii]|nr:hypothetical protein BDZ91DRAFT_765595 [Kalaharituber pfeilii]
MPIVVTFVVLALALFLQITFGIKGLDGRVESIETNMNGGNARVGILETKMDTLEARMQRVEARMDAVEARVDAVEARLDVVEARLDVVEARLDAVEARLDAVEARLEHIDKTLSHIAQVLEALIELTDPYPVHISFALQSGARAANVTLNPPNNNNDDKAESNEVTETAKSIARLSHGWKIVIVCLIVFVYLHQSELIVRRNYRWKRAEVKVPRQLKGGHSFYADDLCDAESPGSWVH